VLPCRGILATKDTHNGPVPKSEINQTALTNASEATTWLYNVSQSADSAPERQQYVLKRYPQDGVVPVSRSRDTIGAMARSMRDIVILDMVMSSSTPVTQRQLEDAAACASMTDLKTLRLGYPADWENTVDDHVRQRFRKVKAALVQSGITMKPVASPELL